MNSSEAEFTSRSSAGGLLNMLTGTLVEENCSRTLHPNQITEIFEDRAVKQATAMPAKLMDAKGNVLARLPD